MKIVDILCERFVSSEVEVEDTLAIRAIGEANAFSITQDQEEYPELYLLVSSELASLVYFPSRGHPGFCSQRKNVQFENRDVVSFPISKYAGDNLEIEAKFVISWETAKQSALEFCETIAFPTDLYWYEL